MTSRAEGGDQLAQRVIAAERRVVELEAALRRVMEESGTSQMQYKIAQAALKGKDADHE